MLYTRGDEGRETTMDRACALHCSKKSSKPTGDGKGRHIEDRRTQQYFDSVLREEYTSVRKHMVSGFIGLAQDINPTRLLDIGSGTGNFLKLVREACAASELVGLDISLAMLLAAPKVGSLVVGSAWHLPFRRDSFDVAHLDSVLHHLVGTTRNQCRVRGQEALHEAVRVLRPGGYLFVAENFYEPALAGSLVFWLKRLVCLLTRHRRVHGLGAPVTSFYTRDDILRMIAAHNTRLETHECRTWSSARSKHWGVLPGIMRLLVGFRRGKLFVVARKEHRHM